ncbi:MAG TPA: hypothetical protein VFV38_01415 [Ktedonobacteraceae bacterium]|nr:hypothetical protein [Ktedonobacteraceae bacterium]
MNQIELYFAFRERFLALKGFLGISSWELEHFLIWQEQKRREHEQTSGNSEEKHTIPISGKIQRGNFPHGQARRLYLQWLLAKIGQKVGCQVWIAQQDHEKSWNEEPFKQISISSLPLPENRTPKGFLEEIAVLWLRKNEIVAAYEIDPKSSELITSLLRLYDLGVTFGKSQSQLCLVLPKQQFKQACQELAHPLFRQQQEKQRCVLMSVEDLANQGEHILRWATSPSAIENLLFDPEYTQGLSSEIEQAT